MIYQLLAQVELNLRERAAQEDVAIPGAEAATSTEAFGNLIGSVLSVSMVVAAILVLLYLIWGAFEWITSGGDKSKVEGARNKITQALIGIIVLASTTALLMVIQNFLNICVLDFVSNDCQGTNTSPPAPASIPGEPRRR